MTDFSVGMLVIAVTVAMTVGLLIGICGLRVRRIGRATSGTHAVRRSGWAADVPIVGMPATPDFDIPVPGATFEEALRELLDLDGDPVHDDAVRRAAEVRADRPQVPFGQVVIEELDRRLSAATDLTQSAYGIHDLSEKAAAERRRHAATPANEETPAENRQPRNIRLRDHHER